jgi:hypothetical protein
MKNKKGMLIIENTSKGTEITFLEKLYNGTKGIKIIHHFDISRKQHQELLDAGIPEVIIGGAL